MGRLHRQSMAVSRGQDAVSISLILGFKDIGTGHGDDPRGNTLFGQRREGLHRNADLGTRGYNNDLRWLSAVT